jgi:heme-degrading monooxygenase HmoA
MIGRIWRGWTTRENGKAYEEVFRTNVLPEINAAEGCRGAYLLRKDINDEVEFVALTLFESLEAVQRFAGENYQLAVISLAASEVLSRFEECATHYEVIIRPN